MKFGNLAGYYVIIWKLPYFFLNNHLKNILQVSMKAEMEMAMKLLERDVHEKQDTIISLRDQLEDIKHINLEMYTKLQVSKKYGTSYLGIPSSHVQLFHVCE